MWIARRTNKFACIFRRKQLQSDGSWYDHLCGLSSIGYVEWLVCEVENRGTPDEEVIKHVEAGCICQSCYVRHKEEDATLNIFVPIQDYILLVTEAELEGRTWIPYGDYTLEVPIVGC